MKRNKEKTINTILQTALSHFSKKGFEGARMDEIANEAGVNKATLYYHIGDKASLYTTTITQMFKKIKASFTQHINEQQNAQDKLYTFIYQLHKLKHDHPLFPSLMLRELATKGERLSGETAAAIMGIINLFIQIIEEGVEQGTFRPVNSFMLYTTVIGSSLVFHAGYPAFENAVSNNLLPKEVLPEYAPEASAQIIYDLIIHTLEKPNV